MQVELVTDSLPGWAPGTKQYRTSDGKHLAVEAPGVPEGQAIPLGAEPMVDELLFQLGESRAALKLVLRPTAVFLCSPEGFPVDADENDHDPLTPLHVFPSGTTHDEALTQAGYEVV